MAIVVQISPYLGRCSSLYPDHPFKLGYFISADNEDGFDSAIEPKTGDSLLGIFVDPGEWDIHNEMLPREFYGTNWEGVKQRVDFAVSRLERYIKQHPWVCFREVRVEDEDFEVYNADRRVDSPKSALRLLHSEQQLHSDNPGWVKHRSGLFYLEDQPAIYAAIRGRNSKGEKTVFLIQQSKLSSDYYLQGLLIIRETVEEILDMTESQRQELCLEIQR